jgi:hypothetical protein
LIQRALPRISKLRRDEKPIEGEGRREVRDCPQKVEKSGDKARKFLINPAKSEGRATIAKMFISGR